MNNSANKKAASVALATIITFVTPFGAVNAQQKPFDVCLSDSQVKETTTVLRNEPYKSMMQQIEKEREKREAERIAKEKELELARVKAEEEAKLKRTIVVNSDNEATQIGEYTGTFKLTTYNLSEGDCEKSPSDSYYGIASSGYNFNGKDLRCRKIAVDPNVIPMGSTVYLEFPEDYNEVTLPNGTRFELSGSYQAVDVGGAIKGNRIDLFVGGDSSAITKLCYDIGKRLVKVYR